MKKVVVKKKGNDIVSVSATVDPIDYDKLAEAIIRANNIESNKYSMSREWMKFIIFPVFWSVAIIAGILAIAFLIYGGKTIFELANISTLAEVDFSKVVAGIVSFCLGLFLISICLSTVFTAKEIDKETDRQYVAAMFSNIVALVALVVSLVALIKG
ncbi:MAG: hypothetical protein IKC95_00425 [Oscillospiraceae bacterium]|nr:hypothetical protein [Oscillospiraceae bacterium]